MTAKGWGKIAEEILNVARNNNVPVHQNQDLAKVLSNLALGQEIPEELYKAVAEVLAFIYRMNQKDLA